VGTPATTTQGLTEPDMKDVAGFISRAVRDADGSAAASIAAEVGDLVRKYPAYPRG
jgi:glycine hydroxymethyltransferase